LRVKALQCVFTRGDVALVVVAAGILHANGFAVGLILGKATSASFFRIFQPPALVQTLLLPIWPVIWAIVLDQLL
jgi:hypothetical protein